METCGTLSRNGLAAFAGNVNGSYWFALLEPAKPIRSYIYRCGNEFYTEPLEALEQTTSTTAVIAIDASDCAIGLLDGETWQVLDTLTSGVGGKSGRGGQSQRRYERNRENKLTAYYQRAAEHANNILLRQPRLAEIIVSGPGLTKDDFIKKANLDYRLKKLITRSINSEYAGAEGIPQVHNILEATRSRQAEGQDTGTSKAEGAGNRKTYMFQHTKNQHRQ